MRIALSQINPTVGDFSGNIQKMREFYQQAAERGAELVIFPELCVCGYPPADLLEKRSFLERAEAALNEIATWTEGEAPALLCGTVMPSSTDAGKCARNVAVVCENGKITFQQQKMLLPFYDVFDEQRYFEPAQSQSLATIKGRTVAISICEDAWNDKMFWPRRMYAVDPIEELMKQRDTQLDPAGGERLILNISASPYWHGKPEVRQKMIAALARRHDATVVMVNQIGANDSLIFDGGSFAVNSKGEVIAEAARFSESLIIFDSAEPQTLPAARTNEVAATWDALVLGTRDYVRKCGFRKALIGLSGGIDSALVAALAVEALGAENVQGIGMPSEFSSEGSLTDAEQLASQLGISFSVLPVRALYDGFAQVLQPFFAGTTFGLAEENLQPRIRGTLLMALSNKTGALVLTTGNKSEMAVGYCTLYGDMVGALAVIGDVYKTEVYALSRYANRERDVIPEATLTKPPSAELRPGQKDTDSLPPYDVLDPMLRAYVEEYESAERISQTQNVDLDLVRSVIKLVERSEYKRQQAAPVLKVSKKSFGTGRRFPIAVKSEA